MRILLLLFVSFSTFCFSLKAQVTLRIEAKDSVVAGEEFIVDVLVNGFTNITSAQFELGWNPLAFELIRASVTSDTTNGFRINPLDSTLRVLYFDNVSQGSGLTIPEGSNLLSLEFRVLLSGPTGLQCISEQLDVIQTEFIQEALTELDVTVIESCVHLQGTSSTKSLEQPKITFSWPSPEMMTVFHPPASDRVKIDLFDIQGKSLFHIEPTPASTSTLLFLDSPLNPNVVILRYTTLQKETTLLIVRPH